MSKQVLDIEQVKHLQELGLDTSKASMQYIENNNGIQMCIPTEIARYIKDLEKGYIICDAFTLQDILDLLPEEIEKDNKNYYLEVFRNPQRYFVCYYWCDTPLFTCNNELFIDAAYEMLCGCVEKGYIETNK